MVLDSGRSLGDVVNSRTPAYTEVSDKIKADHPTNRSYDGRLPDSMIWNEDLRALILRTILMNLLRWIHPLDLVGLDWWIARITVELDPRSRKMTGV